MAPSPYLDEVIHLLLSDICGIDGHLSGVRAPAVRIAAHSSSPGYRSSSRTLVVVSDIGSAVSSKGFRGAKEAETMWVPKCLCAPLLLIMNLTGNGSAGERERITDCDVSLL